MLSDQSLRERREAVVREHMESENRHEFDVTMATFGHPRYEIVPTGAVYDGEEEGARYFAESRAAFPEPRDGRHAARLRGHRHHHVLALARRLYAPLPGAEDELARERAGARCGRRE